MAIPAGPARDVDGDPVEYGLSADSCLLNGGPWLRVARKEARLTTTDLAEKIGVHSSQVSNYETGKSAIPESRVGAIAAALKLDEGHVRGRLGMWVPGNMRENVSPEGIVYDGAPAFVPGLPAGVQFSATASGHRSIDASPAASGEVYRLAAIWGARAGADVERLFDSVDFGRRLAVLDPADPDLKGKVVETISEILDERPYLRTAPPAGDAPKSSPGRLDWKRATAHLTGDAPSG